MYPGRSCFCVKKNDLRPTLDIIGTWYTAIRRKKIALTGTMNSVLRSALIVGAVSALGVADDATVWPEPRAMTLLGSTALPLAASFRFIATASPPSMLLNRAIERYESLLRQFRDGSSVRNGSDGGGVELASCTVRVRSSSEELRMATDVSHNLSVNISTETPTAVASCSINAATVFGALGAFETFAQLLNGSSTLPCDSITVQDRPDFMHRESPLAACAPSPSRTAPTSSHSL